MNFERIDSIRTPALAARIPAGILGGLLVQRGLRRRFRRDVLFIPVGIGLLLWGIRGHIGEQAEQRDRTLTFSRSILVGASPTAVYEAMQDIELLDAAAGSRIGVTSGGPDRLRWDIEGPTGRSIEWEPRIVEAEADQLEWRESEGTFDPSVSIRFLPAAEDRGTEVHMTVDMDIPGGTLGPQLFAGFTPVSEATVGQFLRRFKSLVETGEVPSLEGNPSGRGRGDFV